MSDRSQLSSAVPDVKVYVRRHSRECTYTAESDLDCNCRKWIYVSRTPTHKVERISARSRSLAVAENKAEEKRAQLRGEAGVELREGNAITDQRRPHVGEHSSHLLKRFAA